MYLDSANNEAASVEDLGQYCAGLVHPHWEERHRAVIKLRRIIAQHTDEGSLQRVIDSGAVGALMEMMGAAEYPQVQLEATWLVTNLAAGTQLQCECLVEKKVIDVFMKLVYADKPVISEQALWGLGNIAGDSPKFRDMVIRKGAVDCFVRIIESCQNSKTIRQATWALSNLCRGAPLPRYDLIKPAIATLTRVIVSGQVEGDDLRDALWAVAYHTEGLKSKVQRVL